MKNDLTMVQNIGGQLGVGAVLVLITSMEGIEPAFKMAGIIVVWAIGAFVSLWAQQSKPAPPDVVAKVTGRRKTTKK